MKFVFRFLARSINGLLSFWYRIAGDNRLVVVDIMLWTLAIAFVYLWFAADGLVLGHLWLLAAIGGLVVWRWLVVINLPMLFTSLPPVDSDRMQHLLSESNSLLVDVVKRLDIAVEAFLQLRVWAVDDYRHLEVNEVVVLREHWREILLLLGELQLISKRMVTYFEVLPKNKEMGFACLSLFYAAEILNLEFGLRIIDQVNQHQFIEEILDDSDVKNGIYPDNYQRLLHNVVHINELLPVYLLAVKLIDWQAKGHQFLDADLRMRLSAAASKVIELLSLKGYLNAAKTTLRMIRRESFQLWFPVQKNLAEAVGNTRFLPKKMRGLKTDDVVKMHDYLQPLDFVITRCAWYLSNAWLPGFWTHVIVYLGQRDQLCAYFDQDEQCVAYMQAEFGKNDLAAVLEDLHADIWQQLADMDPDTGKENTIIEAVAEGVVVRSLQKACEADYAAGLRARIDKLTKLKVMLEIFSHYGKGYDFNFDYTTDATLGCSELVFKSFNRFIKLPIDIQKVSGRLTLPVHEFAKSFAAERGLFKQKSNYFWQFLFFVDGKLTKKRSDWGSERDFTRTVKRTRWDFWVN